MHSFSDTDVNRNYYAKWSTFHTRIVAGQLSNTRCIRPAYIWNVKFEKNFKNFKIPGAKIRTRMCTVPK